MEYEKVANLLDNIPDKEPRFITKKWIEVHDQPVRSEMNQIVVQKEI